MAQYRTFLFSEASLEAGVLTLDARESHHLVRVFRAKVGEAVEALDGRGTRYHGRLVAADAKAARIEIDTVERAPKPQPQVTLLQSIPKGKAMDLILRMATEIGATRVQPVFTDQGDVQIKGDRLRSKVEKWRVTMIEACKQCGLSYLPSLEMPMSLKEWLPAHTPAHGSLRLVASLEDGSRPLGDVLRDAGEVQAVLVAVGPEGDFTAGEYAALNEAGFQPVRLGANVLRAETAAAYMLSVVDQSMNRATPSES
jgi:16S rRNA (uracil1498-N3)-methyltransferase